MHFEPQNLRTIAIVLMVAILFSSRATKGSMRQTAEGLVFTIKPLFAIGRLILLVGYCAMMTYLYIQGRNSGHVANWIPVVLFVFIVIVVIRIPGTITLTPTAIKQTFWFIPSRAINYEDIMALQITQVGRAIRVLGNTRVTITHTPNHSAQADFRREIEQRTGKRATF